MLRLLCQRLPRSLGQQLYGDTEFRYEYYYYYYTPLNLLFYRSPTCPTESSTINSAARDVLIRGNLLLL